MKCLPKIISTKRLGLWTLINQELQRYINITVRVYLCHILVEACTAADLSWCLSMTWLEMEYSVQTYDVCVCVCVFFFLWVFFFFIIQFFFNWWGHYQTGFRIKLSLQYFCVDKFDFITLLFAKSVFSSGQLTPNLSKQFPEWKQNLQVAFHRFWHCTFSKSFLYNPVCQLQTNHL